MRTRSHDLDGDRFDDLFQSREYPTSYWPTEVIVVSPVRIAVAGRTSKGFTEIETWLFSEPRLSKDSAGEVQDIIPGSRTKVTSVFHERVAGKGMVQAMSNLLGAPSPTLLVLFRDSHDLYSLRLNDRRLTKSASALPGAKPGVVHEPNLSLLNWRVINAREHTEQGYVYIFSDPSCVDGDDDEVGTLLFFDSNKDGVLDSSVTLTVSGWEAAGYSSAGNWVK